MASTEIRFASEEDWDELHAFYKRAYRATHPLQDIAFWRWQFGSDGGESVVITDGARIVGHLGATPGAGVVWITNLFLDDECRGKGLVSPLYGKARALGPLAATNVNAIAMAMYRRMGWIRYCDLQRFVSVRPDCVDSPICEIASTKSAPTASGDRFWEQPGVEGIVLEDGTTAELRRDVGGLRLMNVVDPARAAENAWDLGFRWVDALTSWNDPLCREFEKANYTDDHTANLPWSLAPVIPDSRCHVSLLSEEPLPNNLIVTRTCSDHARVGSR